MRYKGKVYRPPSEAYSLIVQVTYGCSHNSCAFCDMYDDKHFSMRPMQEIREDFELARRVYHRVERVFLADGDALMRKTDELIEILGLIYGLFPECERVTCYASPTSLQIKSEDDLRLLRARGLRMVYMGLESGCDAVLTRMNKGHDAAAIVAAGQKARRCGLALSVTAISGLGSRELLRWADTIEEIKTVCWCGRKATFNARVQDGHIVREGEQIMMGGNSAYVSLCRRHWKDGNLGSFCNLNLED